MSPPSLTTGARRLYNEGKWARAQRRRGLFPAQAQLVACLLVSLIGRCQRQECDFLFECDFSLQRQA